MQMQDLTATPTHPIRGQIFYHCFCSFTLPAAETARTARQQTIYKPKTIQHRHANECLVLKNTAWRQEDTPP